MIGNNLKKIPESIGNLILLNELFIGDGKETPREYENRIEYLPESLGNLVQLKRLWLQRIDLVEMPLSITNLVNLEDFLYYQNYRMKPLPASFVKPFIAVSKYYNTDY